MRHLVAALLLCASSLPAWALPYNAIYFFGDSLTDVGNVQNTYAAIPPALLPPGSPAVIPGTPYDSEGRASNGDIYADVLAQRLGFSATPSTAGGNDYAYGGARTRYQTMGASFKGINAQIEGYLSPAGNNADAGALYVVWGGANNLQDLLAGKTTDALGNRIPTLGETVADIIAGITGLYNEGARSFLVPNVPNLALVPRVSEKGAAAQIGAYQLSNFFNYYLALALADLDRNYADIDIIAFDTYGALNAIIANPSSFGIGNTTERCYTGDDLTFTGGGTVCANPDSYLFWDGIHPTSAVSTLLGKEMVVAMGLPEPGSLALLAIALLALAIWSSRRAVAGKPLPKPARRWFSVDARGQAARKVRYGRVRASARAAGRAVPAGNLRVRTS